MSKLIKTALRCCALVLAGWWLYHQPVGPRANVEWEGRHQVERRLPPMIERPIDCKRRAGSPLRPQNKRGALIKGLDKPQLHLTTPIGRGIALLSAFAHERQRMANVGRAVAKARRVKFGRKPKLTGRQQTEGRRRLEAGESARTNARSFNVHHATVLSIGTVHKTHRALEARGMQFVDLASPTIAVKRRGGGDDRRTH